jgi:uncharacterized membrane protein YesL
VTREGDDREYRIPDAPRIGGSIRAALIDFYFNSWRLVPANALWGVGLIAVALLAFVFPLGGLVLTVLLAVPTAGIFRLAALIVRDEPVAFSDALVAWRTFLRPALLAGLVLVAVSGLLLFNVALALLTAEPLLWIAGTAAAWGLLAAWAVALPFWPLLVDPLRQEMSLRDRAQLAMMLVVISPLRFGVLLLIVAVLVAVSAVLFAALLTVTIAFVALLAARYTLPAADRFEGRQTKAVPG